MNTGRQTHLEWAKKRAIEFAEKDDFVNAISSLASDLQKHKETNNHIAIQFAFYLFAAGKLPTKEQVIHFIKGVQ